MSIDSSEVRQRNPTQHTKPARTRGATAPRGRGVTAFLGNVSDVLRRRETDSNPVGLSAQKPRLGRTVKADAVRSVNALFTSHRTLLFRHLSHRGLLPDWPKISASAVSLLLGQVSAEAGNEKAERSRALARFRLRSTVFYTSMS